MSARSNLDAKVATSQRWGSFLNFTTKWGCQLSDTRLRGPFLIVSFVLVLPSVATQKLSFLAECSQRMVNARVYH